MTEKAKKVVDSYRVQDYKPPAAIRKLFEEFEALTAYTVNVCGKPAPQFIRLKKDQYSKLADLIHTRSDKRRTLRDVTYNGLRIINETEAA